MNTDDYDDDSPVSTDMLYDEAVVEYLWRKTCASDEHYNNALGVMEMIRDEHGFDGNVKLYEMQTALSYFGYYTATSQYSTAFEQKIRMNENANE